jgi:hypothetical protein
LSHAGLVTQEQTGDFQGTRILSKELGTLYELGFGG